MNRTALYVVIFAIGLLIAGLYYYLRGKEYVIELTEPEIQQKLGERFPITKCYLRIMCLLLSDPFVKFEENTDRIGFGANAELNININDKQLKGSGEFTGTIRYASDSGEFYLDNSEVTRLEITGVPDQYSKRVKELAKTMIDDYLKKRPIYRLKSTDVKHAVTRLILKDVRIKNRVLVITLGIGS